MKLVWHWRRELDDDGHTFWTANGYSIWRAGGNDGDYLTEHGTRHAQLADAKASVVAYNAAR